MGSFLESIMATWMAGKGVPLGPTRIYTLAYADDLALTDDGDTEGFHRATSNQSDINLWGLKMRSRHQS